MPQALPVDDDTYALVAAYAKQQHCSLNAAIRKLVTKAAQRRETQPADTAIRFPLVRGQRPITNDDVARLQDGV